MKEETRGGSCVQHPPSDLSATFFFLFLSFSCFIPFMTAQEPPSLFLLNVLYRRKLSRNVYIYLPLTNLCIDLCICIHRVPFKAIQCPTYIYMYSYLHLNEVEAERPPFYTHLPVCAALYVCIKIGPPIHP